MRDVVELTKALCAISSVTGNEKEVCDYVAELLKNDGYEVEVQALPGQNRANVFAQLKHCKPNILLTTHLDTVPPFIPAAISSDGEWLVGRGVCDAKGIAAAMLCAANRLKVSKFENHALLFVVGEETVSDGAKFAAQTMTQSFNYVINGEPTDMKLASSMKGALVFEMSAQGKAGHSAYPQSGHSAVHQLIQDASRIINFPWPSSPAFGQTTANIGVFNGGKAPNVLASEAYLNGVVRLTCSVDEGKEHLSGLVDPKTSLRFLSASAPRQLHTVAGFETCHVAYGCDIPHLEKLGTPLLFGPGSILDAHTDGEKVRIKDLHDAVNKYQDLCRMLA